MLAKVTLGHLRFIQKMRPIVAVVGTTGSGKSQLAVHLAQSLEAISEGRTSDPRHGDKPSNDSLASTRATRFCHRSGIVLSADSMQLYKGLDVITNKVTEDEMGGVDHWGLNMISPGRESSWELGKWCTEAGKVVETLAQDVLPIVCGGTHYFIQHFLFPPPELSTSRPSSPINRLPEKDHVKTSSSRWSPPHSHPPVPDLDPELSQLLETFWTSSPVWPKDCWTATSTLEDAHDRTSGAASWSDAQLLCLHRLLLAVNPREAGRWHWRDGRKVKRSLERWWESKDESKEGSKEGRRARFRTLIFWVYEPMETLRPRLDRRVEKMVENGLLQEIAELRGMAQDVHGSPEAADHTEGIFQAIGYKEFTDLPIDAHSTSDPTTHPAFASMLDRMKISTHQYAKSQLKWITKQLIPAVREARETGGDVWVYAVPGGESNEGLTKQILSDFLSENPMADPMKVGHVQSRLLLGPLYSNHTKVEVLDIASRQAKNARRECDLCSTVSTPYSVMLKDWDSHVKSKLHRRNMVAAEGGREALIEKQRKAGMEKAAERAKMREAKQSLQDPP